MSPRTIAGVLPIAHTPLLENEEIDYASLARQIDWALEQGAAGFCTGMVSELLRLTAAERQQLTKELAAMNAGRGVFIAGVGAESTRQAVEYATAAEQAGCDGLMAIPPTTTALPDDQLEAYFRALADATAVPLIVQDASSYVGREIPLAVSVRLLESYGPEKIRFKPEAAPIGPNLSALRDATAGKAKIYEGSGGILLVDSFRRSVAGTMPGMEMLPAQVALWQALERGDDEAIYGLYFPICALVALQMQAGLDGFLAVEKYLLHQQGLFTTARRRSPNGWELDKETAAEVDRLMIRLNAAVQRYGSR